MIAQVAVPGPEEQPRFVAVVDKDLAVVVRVLPPFVYQAVLAGVFRRVVGTIEPEGQHRIAACSRPRCPRIVGEAFIEPVSRTRHVDLPAVIV